MKYFNTTTVCIPSKHYMVDLSDRIKEIKQLIDDGKYFTINRARQYGKTTTINELTNRLKGQYTVINLSFEGIEETGFSNVYSFVKEFCRLLIREFRREKRVPENIKEKIDGIFRQTEMKTNLADLFDVMLLWCEKSEQPIVLIIDEVDSATNNQVFLDFLAQLRYNYIERETKGYPTFQSVILAGVTDIKHLKLKIKGDVSKKENSPWNIAADFNIDMSLSENGIKEMLDDYEAEHNAGMDTAYMAKLIREYTNGYPFLVSRICELIDKEVYKKFGNLSDCWTRDGMDEAVKLILAEDNTLFKSMTTKLNNLPKIKDALRSILMEGTKLSFNPDQDDIALLRMYGFIRNENNSVKIDNRIFETRLYNLFLSDEELDNNVFFKEAELSKNIFVENGKLNVRLILQHFIETYKQIYGELSDKFKEKDGRELFLLYLKPIINGTGNYYIEAQTRNQKRTDVIIDYLGKQYIIELKIWHGERYNQRGEEQLSEYLDYFGLDTGYMLSFNFNKQKEVGIKQVHVGDKMLFEATL